MGWIPGADRQPYEQLPQPEPAGAPATPADLRFQWQDRRQRAGAVRCVAHQSRRAQPVDYAANAYGSLEQLAAVVYSIPHIFNNPQLDFSLSGGYKNAQDITTYAASRLEGTVQIDAKAQTDRTR